MFEWNVGVFLWMLRNLGLAFQNLNISATCLLCLGYMNISKHVTGIYTVCIIYTYYFILFSLLFSPQVYCSHQNSMCIFWNKAFLTNQLLN